MAKIIDFIKPKTMSDDANHVLIEKSFRIKQDDRFFSKIITKEETSGANSSSRVFYYGETSVAIPFVWEAQPGIPKHPLSENFLPPLTPPPSYYSNFSKSDTNKRRESSKANIFSCILPRFVACSRRKTHVSTPSSSPHLPHPPLRRRRGH